MNLRLGLLSMMALISFAAQSGKAVELVSLTEENWIEFAPQGKEVDCIYGDYVLRNEHIVTVIADPLPTRNANMTVQNVGGMIIDLTSRDEPNDQLSAFFAGGSRVSFGKVDTVEVRSWSDREAAGELGIGRLRLPKPRTGENVSIKFAAGTGVKSTVKYTLSDSDPFIVVETTYNNESDAKVTIPLNDLVRADRSFAFGADEDTHLFWAHDQWFRQGYGVVAEDYQVKEVAGRARSVEYWKDGKKTIVLAPKEKYTLKRKVFPAADRLQLRAVANKLSGIHAEQVEVEVTDPTGPVAHARITITDGQKIYGSARTSTDGKLAFALPAGKYSITVKTLGRPDKVVPLDVEETARVKVQLEACGCVAAKITDESGDPIPCKVAFHGIDATASPYFGPDSAAVGVQNLHYSHTGEFRQEIGPGKYEVIISRGPEYDAIVKRIEVAAGEDTQLTAKLVRVVDTTGWISSDFHSHSTPSGDNTASQLGRVLNLLCEHLEFAPCTEHNRIDSYTPHLKQLKVEHLMATCTGMELTGNPLPVNHQNAFPLIHKPHTQDGGGPHTHDNPVAQIERLALWDDRSDKLVQLNHPNLVQVIGDKNLDGKPDGGFRKMFGFMDVIEVHPPVSIFVAPGTDEFKSLRRNPIFHWMQMLNHGYRIPGTVNTDAHYNFHESGWLRNYIKSPTDDPAKIKTMDMVHAAEHGHLVMSNGPFLEVSLKAEKGGKRSPSGPGEDVAAPGGKASLTIRVQCANWLDVDRVQVFLNGRMEKHLNFTRRTTPDKFGDEVVKFAATLPLELKSDTHVIVATAGEGFELGRVMGPKWGKKMPVAVSNPIFVDVDGDGFQPNGDDLGVPLPLDEEDPAEKN